MPMLLSLKLIVSENDQDQDGTDDYTDILNGAREFVSQKPKYKSKYYAGGYPTDGYYVCTDVIWYALKSAGYDLKSMMDNDIKNHQADYAIEKIDPNIDFRRVKNIKVFLDKYGKPAILSYMRITLPSLAIKGRKMVNPILFIMAA